MGVEPMGDPFPEPESVTQEHPQRFLVVATLASIIKRLANLMKFTEEEREEAGIYLDRPGGE
jgi:hypothetical protein